MSDPVTIRAEQVDVVVFDMDGVVTDTASTHFRAWKRLFDTYLEQREGEGFDEFTEQDYLAHVDGKPRYDGVRDFLASRDIELPEGDDGDDPSAETVRGLGLRKNAHFTADIEEHGVQRYESTVALIDQLHDAGVKAALISSSRNAVPVLEAAGVTELFDNKVDGVDADERGIAGKPAPDVFVTAAADLGVPPERAVVVEDAVSGVQAGGAGDFALVIGVDRGGNRDALAANGADVVVDDLAEVRVEPA